MPRTTGSPPATTAYEQSRTERIRMLQQQMNGMLQASNDLKATVEKQTRRPVSRKQRRPAQKCAVAPRELSSRRSGRLAGHEAVTYNEDVLAAVDGVLDSSTCVRATPAPLSGQWGNAGRRSEVYNDAHVGSLGVAETEWTLFVDGYCPNTGKRVYDRVDGVTCHQCRQKTLGKRTSCSKCESLFGNFCGDCLYMRYGENINEVASNPQWICPCCRDICNCSFHRSRAGWAPTGTMYRRAQADGYLSVAHCLILNNLDPETLKNIVAGNLSVPGGYPEDWAKEHGAPYPPVSLGDTTVNHPPAVIVEADPHTVVHEQDAGHPEASCSQSSHSACTGERLGDLQPSAAAENVTRDMEPSAAVAADKTKKLSNDNLHRKSSARGCTAKAACPMLTRTSVTGAKVEAAKASSLAVAVPVRKATRASCRRSLASNAVEQPALPPAPGGSVATAWLSARR